MKDFYLQMQDMAVGYHRNPLIHDICIDIKKGEITTLIGPNGSGKSTILKSITRQLKLLGGKVMIAETDMNSISGKDLSTRLAVVLTDRLKPELMTCHDIVATGRYPYTGRLGILSKKDEQKVTEALKTVHALELAHRDFNQISDGQKQRILLARAICQEPELIVLDEPTSFLDIRHKLELLSILRQMTREKGITVIMSLHEIDLAQKISDKIICVKGETIAGYGTPEEIFRGTTIHKLYEMDNGTFDPCFGSIELTRPVGNAEVFVISSCGNGIPVYRRLQKENIPFAAGILYTNDIDYQVAKYLAASLVTEEPFQEIKEETYQRALTMMQSCRKVICAGFALGDCNRKMQALLEEAQRTNILIQLDGAIDEKRTGKLFHY